MDRRTFVRMAGLGVGGWLVACAAPAPAASAPVTRSALLPTLVPFQGPTPDLAANPATGLQPGYFTYPKNLVKSVPKAPGLGGTVTALVEAPGSLPRPVAQNPTWQFVNKTLNANVELQMIPSGDYRAKVATVMAGGDLPDLLFITRGLNVGNMPQFLKAAAADLTPFIGGDKSKDYSNLAAFPTSTWRAVSVDKKIFAVPLIRPPINWVWYYNVSLWDAAGVKAPPKNAAELKKILVDFTRPKDGVYGFGALAPTYGLITAGSAGDAPQLAMFGAPNNWAVDASGKFTKDIETEQFRMALDYVRDLYAAGVYYPDPTMPLAALRNHLVSGKIAFTSNGWAAYRTFLWEPGAAAKPPVKIRAMAPFSADGTSKPIQHQFSGVNGITIVKKGSESRVQELLGMLNFFASPFGTQEYDLMVFGRSGEDHTFDARGVPSVKADARANVSVPWQRISTGMPELFSPTDPEYVKAAHADAQLMLANLLPDPTIELYSDTDASKGVPLMTKFGDGIGEIITGRRPMSGLAALLQEWRSGGGDQIRTEYQQAFADAKR